MSRFLLSTLNKDVVSIIDNYLLPSKQTLINNKNETNEELKEIDRQLITYKPAMEGDYYQYILFETFHSKVNNYLAENFKDMRDNLPSKCNTLKELFKNEQIIKIMGFLKKFKSYNNILQYERYYEYIFMKDIVDMLIQRINIKKLLV